MLEPLIVTSFDTLRVLVIDDDRAILDVVEAILKAAGIGGVVKAVSALGALNILADKQKRFNCIVCDYGMDVMDGLALLREIRSGKHAYIPRDQCFIMLTAHGQEDVVRTAVELDVNGYVRKPVSKDSIIKAIHRAFNRSPALKAPEFYAAVAVPTQG